MKTITFSAIFLTGFTLMKTEASDAPDLSGDSSLFEQDCLGIWLTEEGKIAAKFIEEKLEEYKAKNLSHVPANASEERNPEEKIQIK